MIDIRTRLRRRWIRLVVAPVGVVALVGLAACGTSTEHDVDSSGVERGAAQPSTADDADGRRRRGRHGRRRHGMADYRSCLEENGVTMPEPPAGGGRGPAAGRHAALGRTGGGRRAGRPRRAPARRLRASTPHTWAAAQEACADLAPTPPDGSAPTASSGN